jgi:hypothetical protein
MSKKRRPGSFLLPLIAKILAERIGDDVEQLSDAELLRSMAQRLSRHDDEFPLIACALAVGFERGPNEAEDLAKAADLLADMGLEFDPAELRAVRRSEACAEFQSEFCRVPPPAGLSDAEAAVRHAGLRDCLLRAGEAFGNS